MTAPKYLQASLSALGDVATYSLAKKIYGNHLAPYIVSAELKPSWADLFSALASRDLGLLVSLFDGGKDVIEYSGNSVYGHGNARLAIPWYYPRGFGSRIEVNKNTL